MKRMNLKTLLALIPLTAVVAFVMTSCKSDNKNEPQEGSPTTISLNIKQPVNTYAADGNAKEEEVVIGFVDVFIYEYPTLVQYVKLDVATDFTQTAAGSNEYKLNADKAIKTTIGRKQIYIGANLPTAVVDVLKGNPYTAIEVLNIAELMDTGNGGFAMFATQPIETKLSIDPSNPANNLSTSITRLLSKVATIQANTVNPNIPGGTINNLQFAISNNNTKFFAPAKTVSSPANSYEDPNWAIGSSSGQLYKAVASDYVPINAESGFDPKTARTVYTLENTSEGFRQDESTYVTIRGQFLPTNIVKLTTPGDGSSPLIADAAIALGETFYAVVAGGIRSFFSIEQDALDYAATMLGQASKYTNGWSYYNVFLNPEAIFGAKYDVLRNCFFRLRVTEVKGIGAGEDVDGGNVPIVDSTDIDVDIDIEGWVDEVIDAELD